MPGKTVRRENEMGEHGTAFEKNKRRIYKTETVCAICGKPVDMSLRYPLPMSKCIDHIIPISRGGHPSDIGNLQLAHLTCNRAKSDRIKSDSNSVFEGEIVSNRLLPQLRDWKNYKVGD